VYPDQNLTSYVFGIYFSITLPSTARFIQEEKEDGVVVYNNNNNNL
jgi:hypothetical protein